MSEYEASVIERAVGENISIQAAMLEVEEEIAEREGW